MVVQASTIEVVMPAMGDSVAEGTVLEWRKQEGDAIAVDETLVEISTDKVDAEVPSPVAGTIVKLHRDRHQRRRRTRRRRHRGWRRLGGERATCERATCERHAGVGRIAAGEPR